MVTLEGNCVAVCVSSKPYSLVIQWLFLKIVFSVVSYIGNTEHIQYRKHIKNIYVYSTYTQYNTYIYTVYVCTTAHIYRIQIYRAPMYRASIRSTEHIHCAKQVLVGLYCPLHTSQTSTVQFNLVIGDILSTCHSCLHWVSFSLHCFSFHCH